MFDAKNSVLFCLVFHSRVGVKHLDGSDRQTSTGKLNWTVEKNKQSRRKINKISEFDVNVNGCRILTKSFEYLDMARSQKKAYEIRNSLMHRTWTSRRDHKSCPQNGQLYSTPPLTNIQNILKGKQETVSPWIDERKSSELMTLSVTCWLWHNRMKNTQSECIRGNVWGCSFHSKEKLV